MNEVEASKSVLIEVLSILARDRDKIVVVHPAITERGIEMEFCA